MNIIQLALAAFLIVSGALFLLHIANRATTSHRMWLLSIFVSGSMLRFIYCCLTPYRTRALDWWGHIEYVEYVLANWRIPPAQEGWQFYQPPLYYFSSALWAKLGILLGRADGVPLADLRLFACLMSIGAFAGGIWIGEMLFKSDDEKSMSIWFAGVLAVFPGFVHFASRISNDVPLLLFSVLFLAFLIRWWNDNRTRDVYAACAFLCLGLLTKLNVLPLAAVLAICLVVHRKSTWSSKVRTSAVCLAMIALSTGWLFYLRYGVEGERSVVGNRLGYRLRVDNHPANFLVFNPVGMLEHPYNNTLRDRERRDYFWEFAYRSAQFGEFNHGAVVKPLARSVLLLALAGLPLLIAGLVITLKREFHSRLPIWLTFLLLVAALFCYRFSSPFASNQDYRFIPVVLVPATYFILRAISCMPSLWKQLSLAIAGVYIGCSAGFTIWLLV